MARGAARTVGLSLAHWLESFERVYDAETAWRLRERLPAEVAGAIDAGLDPKAWYPVAWFRELLAAGCEVTGDGLEMVADVARASARAEFSGINRILVLFVSPQRLLQKAAGVFDRYYSEGRVVTEPSGPRAAQVRWIGCREFDRNIWHDVWNATAVLIEMCGGRDVRWEPTDGGGDADDHATVLYRWR